MLSHAQAIIDRAIATCGIKPCCRAQFVGIDQSDWLQIFWAVAGLRDEFGPMAILVPITTLANEGLIGEAFGHNDMRHGGQYRDIGARA